MEITNSLLNTYTIKYLELSFPFILINYYNFNYKFNKDNKIINRKIVINNNIYNEITNFNTDIVKTSIHLIGSYNRKEEVALIIKYNL